MIDHRVEIGEEKNRPLLVVRDTSNWTLVEMCIFEPTELMSPDFTRKLTHVLRHAIHDVTWTESGDRDVSVIFKGSEIVLPNMTGDSLVRQIATMLRAKALA